MTDDEIISEMENVKLVADRVVNELRGRKRKPSTFFLNPLWFIWIGPVEM